MQVRGYAIEGVKSKFTQNCTLSQEYKWIRGLRKHSFANDMALYYVVRVGLFHNPLAKQDREVRPIECSLACDFEQTVR